MAVNVFTGPVLAGVDTNIDSATKYFLPGSIGWGNDLISQANSGNLYKYILNGAAALQAQYAALTWDPTNASGDTRGIVPTTATFPNLLGIVAGSGGITNANYGWVCVRGMAQVMVNASASNIAAGNYLKGINSSHNLTYDTAGATGSGAAASFPGNTVQAIAGSSSSGATALVNCVVECF